MDKELMGCFLGKFCRLELRDKQYAFYGLVEDINPDDGFVLLYSEKHGYTLISLDKVLIISGGHDYHGNEGSDKNSNIRQS